VPTAHGKADLTVYRECGAKVVAVLGAGGPVERASVDEAYIDVTIQVLYYNHMKQTNLMHIARSCCFVQKRLAHLTAARYSDGAAHVAGCALGSDTRISS
jgi:nucleotidyltransferase/DNA polymerase involved in DNA repair